jgi:hypothetical protein
MNLQKLKVIINSVLPDNTKEQQIIGILAEDEKVFSLLMKILDAERTFKKELTSDMNLLLSKAHIGLDNKKFNEGNFMQKEIVEFYTKYKGFVGHCFKNLFENEEIDIKSKEFINFIKKGTK